VKEVILCATFEIAAASNCQGGVIARPSVMCCREVKPVHAETHLVE